MHPYLSPDWAEQHRRASRCTEAEPLRTRSPSRLPYSAGRSQESGHLLPPSNALMDMFATHRVSSNLGEILLQAFTESEIAPALTAVSSELGPSSSTEMPHTGWSRLHPPPAVSLSVFLNWRIIALQCCGALCHTSKLISHNEIYLYISLPS